MNEDKEEVTLLRQKLAEYAMMVDLLTNLPESQTYIQTIDLLLSLSQEICAPRCVGFIPTEFFTNQKTVVIPTGSDVKTIEEVGTLLGAKKWVCVDAHFAVSVNAGKKRCGILVIIDAQHAGNIEQYAHLLFTMSSPLGLVMANTQFQSALLESERNYRLLAENATDVVWRLDEKLNMVWASPSLEAVLGWLPKQVLGSKLIDLIHPEDQSLLSAGCGSLFLKQNVSDIEMRIRKVDNSYMWVSVQLRATKNFDGVVDGVVVGLRNIHDQVLARSALERSESLFRLAMDGAPQGMAIVGLGLQFLQVNPALCQMLGYSQQWLLEHTLKDVIFTEDLESDMSGNNELIVGTTKKIERESRWRRANGSVLWVVHSTSLLRDENNSPLFHVSHIQDNTQGHAKAAELAYQANHDPLTGLMNRGKLEERINVAIAFKPRRSGMAGLLFCDIDFFKTVNDTYGHTTGDVILHAVGQRLVSTLRSGDVVARIGGDEFVVILNQVYDTDAARLVGQKICKAMREPFVRFLDFVRQTGQNNILSAH